MNTEHINNLLQKYMDGETTIQEEKLLKAYFQGDVIAKELKQYASLFQGFSQIQDIKSNQSLFQIPNNNSVIKKKFLPQISEPIAYVVRFAAGIIVLLGVYVAFNLLFDESYKKVEDTFSQPKEAYAYVIKTMSSINDKMNKGIKTTQPLYNINKGIEESSIMSKYKNSIEELDAVSKFVQEMNMINKIPKFNNTNDIK